MTVIGWKSCLLWTAHTPCGVNSLRKSNQIKSNQIKPFDAISVAGNVAPCDNVVENVSDNVVENAGDNAERRWASAREALANSCKTRASYGGASTFCGQKNLWYYSVPRLLDK
jgi:hypothetical protein